MLRTFEMAVFGDHVSEEMEPMPQFMDFHDDLKLPDEAIQQITKDTKDEHADEFGVRQVELFHNPDGKVYCLLEAPDAESKPLENPRDLVYFAAWHAKGCVVLPHGLGVWCLK
jgi:hypothetical protein